LARAGATGGTDLKPLQASGVVFPYNAIYVDFLLEAA
jgi:hypothetical protein